MCAAIGQGYRRQHGAFGAIEAEHELVEVVLEVCFAQSVVDAQTLALEISN